MMLELKFGLSEKHTKFEKIFLMVWTFTISKCTKHGEDCANFCVLLRKSELYPYILTWCISISHDLGLAKPKKHIKFCP